MSEMMKALVYTAPGKMEIQKIHVPRIKHDEVLVRVCSCGICGSDVQGYLGKTGRRIPPMVMGHEFSGEIAACGDSVKNFKVGDRVTAQPIRFCGECEYCRAGRESLCLNQKMLGVLNTNGAFAEYVAVWERQLVRIPDSVSFDAAALAEPFAVAFCAVKKSDVRTKRVAVVGTGTIGLMVVLALRLAGAKEIIAVDIAEGKRAMARKIGATGDLDPKDESAVRALIERTGGGIDCSFEAVGAEKSVQTALSFIKKGGTCVWIGNNAKYISINMQQIVTRELHVMGTFDYSQALFAQAVQKMAEFDFTQMIGATIDMEDAPDRFRLLAQPGTSMLKTIIHL